MIPRKDKLSRLFLEIENLYVIYYERNLSTLIHKFSTAVELEMVIFIAMKL